MCRAGPWKTLLRVTLPAVWPAINPVVGLVLLDLWENGSFPQLSAIALVMTVIDAVVVLAVMKGFRRNRG